MSALKRAKAHLSTLAFAGVCSSSLVSIFALSSGSSSSIQTLMPHPDEHIPSDAAAWTRLGRVAGVGEGEGVREAAGQQERRVRVQEARPHQVRQPCRALTSGGSGYGPSGHLTLTSPGVGPHHDSCRYRPPLL